MERTAGKLRRMKALSDARGIIAAAAADQRGSVQRSLAAARGVDVKDISPAMMAEFKTIVTRALAPQSSAILLDPEFGMEAAKVRGRDIGLILAYELAGYDINRPGRLPDLLPHVSVRRLLEMGADAVKIDLYYSPHEDSHVSDVKHALVERVGAECEANDLPFVLGVVGYDPKGGDERSLAYARHKPELIHKSLEEFSKPRYRVDILKLEVPVSPEFIPGSGSYAGQKAFTRDEALRIFRETKAPIPFLFISAGVNMATFLEALRLAGEAGSDYSGVLCGRATWKGGLPIYGRQGAKALEDWMEREGVRNAAAVNQAVRRAKPWPEKLGIVTPA